MSKKWWGKIFTENEKNEIRKLKQQMPVLSMGNEKILGYRNEKSESKMDILGSSKKTSRRDPKRSPMGRQRPIGIQTKSESKPKMKLCLFDVREYEFTSKDGRDIHGFMYSAFTEGGPIQFSSPDGNKKIIPVIAYDAKQAVDLKIRPSLFNGVLKWREDLEG